jgi:hypothetical protein
MPASESLKYIFGFGTDCGEACQRVKTNFLGALNMCYQCFPTTVAMLAGVML